MCERKRPLPGRIRTGKAAQSNATQPFFDVPRRPGRLVRSSLQVDHTSATEGVVKYNVAQLSLDARFLVRAIKESKSLFIPRAWRFTVPALLWCVCRLIALVGANEFKLNSVDWTATQFRPFAFQACVTQHVSSSWYRLHERRGHLGHPRYERRFEGMPLFPVLGDAFCHGMSIGLYSVVPPPLTQHAVAMVKK